MKQICTLAVLLTSMWFTQAVRAEQPTNLTHAGVILKGYDAVSYFKNKEPVEGNEKFSMKVDGATYWFANEANLAEFQKDPKKYEPQFGGWCAYAIADSKSKVDVDPKSFIIQDGKLLMFYKGLWGNTREKWLHTKNKDDKTYLKEAEQNWPSVKEEAP